MALHFASMGAGNNNAEIVVVHRFVSTAEGKLSVHVVVALASVCMGFKNMTARNVTISHARFPNARAVVSQGHTRY